MTSFRLRSPILAASIAVTALVACGGGSGPARPALVGPRPEATARASRTPKMSDVVASQHARELEAMGLDARRLPPFESLSRAQVERLMPLFTRSLGVACTDCHAGGDATAPTRMKRMSVRMWNELARPYTFKSGAPLFCDSCHQGQVEVLRRDDKPAVAEWMSVNFTDKLETSTTPAAEIECESCHGDPAEPRFLATW